MAEMTPTPTSQEVRATIINLNRFLRFIYLSRLPVLLPAFGEGDVRHGLNILVVDEHPVAVNFYRVGCVGEFAVGPAVDDKLFVLDGHDCFAAGIFVVSLARLLVFDRASE